MPLLNDIRSFGRLAVAVALWLAVASCGGDGCSCDRLKTIDAFVPEDATGAVLLTPPGALQEPVAAFLLGIEGKGGVFDLIEGKYGVDLSSGDGIRRAGIEPDLPVAMFRKDGVSVMLIGVSDRDAFERLARDRLLALGYREPKERTEGELDVRLAEASPDSGRFTVAWAYHKNLAIIATGGAAAGEPEVLAVLKSESARKEGQPGLLETDGYRSMAEAIPGRGAGAFAYYDLGALNGADKALRGLLEPLGVVVGGMAESAIDKARDLGVRFSVEADRIALDALLRTDEGALESDWLKVDAKVPDFGGMLPRETTLFLRARLNVAKVHDIPAFLRDTLLPEGILGRLHPILAPVDVDRHLISHLTGNLAFAFIGLDDDAVLGKLLASRSLAGAVKQLEVVLMLQVKDAGAFLAEWPEVRAVAIKRGFTVGEAPGIGDGPPVIRMSHPKTREDYSVLLVGDVVLVTAGKATYREVRDVLEGRATALRERAESPLMKRVVGSEGSEEGGDLTLGAFFTFARITRQLGDQGAPPFYLRVINSIFELGAGLTVEGGSVRINVEAVQ